MAFQPANFLLGLPGTVFGAIASTGDAPAITSDGGGATADVSVNTGDTAVTTVTATGTGTEVFSIVGGAEALMFTINSSSGALAFTNTSVDGEYEVIVQATNDWGRDRQTITVTVEAGYHADAVHFDGATYLDNENLASTTSPHAAGSFWVKTDQSSIDDERIIQAAGGGAGVAINVQIDGSVKIRASVSGGSKTDIVSTAGAIVANTWVNIRYNADTLAQTGAVYAGLLNVTDSVTPIGVGGSMALNGKLVAFPDSAGDEYAIAGDMAEVWFAGQQVDMAYAAAGGSFIDAGGKPKDLGPTGAVPTGVAPEVFLSGNATSFGTNKGTGGAFTTTGTLTNASTSPSD